jgi:hypothetical protein
LSVLAIKVTDGKEGFQDLEFLEKVVKLLLAEFINKGKLKPKLCLAKLKANLIFVILVG